MACSFANVLNSCGCIIGYNLPLQTVDEVDIEVYPVTVLNVDEEPLAEANSPSQYAAIWNMDPANQAVGKLFVGPGAFCFFLAKTNVIPPSNVLGGYVEGEGLVTDDDLQIVTDDDIPITK